MRAIGYQQPGSIDREDALTDIELPAPKPAGRDILVEVKAVSVNPVDEEAARHSFFRGLAASGWHTAAITMPLMVDGGPPFATGLIGAGAEVAWPNATRPGDTLTVFSEIADLRSSASRSDRGWITVQSETRTSDDTVVQTLRARMLVFRAPAGSDS